MAKKRRKKALPPSTAWGPGNPPPRSPGRPPKEAPPEPVLDSSVPVALAAVRAAAAWEHGPLPKMQVVRLNVVLKRKSAKDFLARWDALERGYGGKGGVGSGVSVVGEGGEVAGGLDEGSVRVVETCEEFLKRHLAASGVLRG